MSFGRFFEEISLALFSFFVVLAVLFPLFRARFALVFLSSVGEGKTFVPLLLLGRRHIYYSNERHAPQRRTKSTRERVRERESVWW